MLPRACATSGTKPLAVEIPTRLFRIGHSSKCGTESHWCWMKWQTSMAQDVEARCFLCFFEQRLFRSSLQSLELVKSLHITSGYNRPTLVSIIFKTLHLGDALVFSESETHFCYHVGNCILPPVQPLFGLWLSNLPHRRAFGHVRRRCRRRRQHCDEDCRSPHCCLRVEFSLRLRWGKRLQAFVLRLAFRRVSRIRKRSNFVRRLGADISGHLEIEIF
mmetsp:Transcript_97602/g.152609  ORF Transcript_97602/g.152609 Transcript_97602/m.152609 type:complete len:218 (-) Transcript_97602:177-830(-)